ncbi:hypothetical protein FRB99_001624, partial [Tulasnella sp. 403]
FKSLSRRPALDKELERWLMYWSVVGCIVALEYVAEWSDTLLLVPKDRLPAVARSTTNTSTFDTSMSRVIGRHAHGDLFGRKGATHIYQAHLAPFLTTYEPSIDAYLSEYKGKLYSFIRKQLRVLWSHITAAIAQQTGINLNNVDPSASPSTAAAQGQSNAAGQPGNLNQGAQFVLGLWHAWGPTIVNALRPPVAEQPAQQQQPPLPSVSSHATTTPQSEFLENRRRQLKAELDELEQLKRQLSTGAPLVAPSTPGGKSIYHSDAGSASDASLGTNVQGVRDGRGDYEEIDKEDVGEDELSDEATQTRPASGWFNWGRRTSGYDRVKSD